MKKIIAACSVLLATTGFANADNYSNPNMLEGMDFSKLYVGADLGYIDMDLKAPVEQADNSLPMLNAYLGYEFDHDQTDRIKYAVEFGGYISKNADKSTSATGQVDSQEYAIFMDVIGKYQLPHNFTALGSAGLQYSKLSIQGSGTDTTDVNEYEFAPRVGAGLEYKVNDKINLRGMARYVFADYSKSSESSMQYTLGMNYKF